MDVHDDTGCYQRQLVKTARQPADLYSAVRDEFTCPHCSKPLYTRNDYRDKRFSTRLVHIIRCRDCQKSICLLVPSIRKKRVYLDQSLISNLFDVCTDVALDDTPRQNRQYIPLLNKIREAKRNQKAFFVISDIHATETAAVPRTEKQNAIWQFANSLADGRIAGDDADAFEEELKALLGREFGPVPKPGMDCYVRERIDKWDFRSPILLGNSWRLQFITQWVEPRAASESRFKDIIERQADDAVHFQSATDCVVFVCGLCVNDILDAIRDLQRLMADMRAMMEMPKPNGYFTQVQKVIGLDHSKCERLQTIEREVKSNGLAAFPSLQLSASIEGYLLWQWKQRVRQNPKRFSEYFGVSRNMDVTHISVFAPLVDALTTDNDMYNLCQHPVIQEQLHQYPCQLFSSKTLSDFEAWLDTVISEPESDEFRLTRRLLYGRNAAEQEIEDAKAGDLIMAEFLSLKAQKDGNHSA